jgi:undecaprenyl-diphosphatase
VVRRGSSAGVSARPRRANVAEAAAVLGGAALLAGSWVVVVAQEAVPNAEARAFEAVNGLPSVLWPVVWVPMQAGSVAGSLVVIGAATWPRRDVKLAVAAIIASQGAFWTAKIVKSAVSRGRPADLLADIELREEASGLGYISGHTAVAFATAAVLTPSLPRVVRPFVWSLAVTVGVARIYAGAHLPLDVVGGAGAGLLWGTLTRWAMGLGGEGLPPRAS